jgi:hypothetical protein
MTPWPNVMCRTCLAFPAEPCRTLNREPARRPHAPRLRDAAGRAAALRAGDVIDLAEWARARDERHAHPNRAAER